MLIQPSELFSSYIHILNQIFLRTIVSVTYHLYFYYYVNHECISPKKFKINYLS